MKAKVRIEYSGFVDAEVSGSTETEIKARIRELQAAADFYTPIAGVQILFDGVEAVSDEVEIRWREDEDA